MRFSAVLASAATASAAVIGRQINSSAGTAAKLLVGSSNRISIVSYDGKEFKVVDNYTDTGVASWMAFKEPNLIYAVDENSADLRLFTYDAASDKLQFVTNSTGSRGVVSLAFTADQKRLVGASYGQGSIDIWDISSGTDLKLLKQLNSTDPVGPNTQRQDQNRAHQAILDPSGRFFAVNDLGSDRVLIIDSKDDAFVISNSNSVPAGCGPRHGSWYPTKAEQATHYMVLCELTNQVEVFQVSYNGTGVGFAHTQELSTFGAAFPPANASTAAAGEIAISSDSKNVYVSNRVTGNETDSIAHFKVKQTAAAGGSPCKATAGGIELEFVDSVSSGGTKPRMMSLSKDESILYVGNQDGQDGIVAFARGEDGKLTAGATLSKSVIGTGEDFGPQYVQQIA
ncbi:putative 6-phosphogluconolactonase [Colletotrichum fructicola]|uniref:Carboxy-cis,cis-muconate cyclase n=1 Tax=Colletotrichum fructicola (strain Nara gc5) TaxID=1213859 RepID=L2FJ00_COLFN|nr:uncharacterized protein CGMCC3_g2404 [Colletotrichum fructicola]KAF4492228.1 putative 6-phosphogluconolactonase [Colletotrichum fructicola Nara gc5]KAI8285499.1 hypothetical protein K4K60_001165 [Colletotrichum sp. SAR11_57]KAE9581824.1 hypothetical protein CGMCC3_g2404 [Colletotrichum fructicola]KAF4424996.1 putative 6-phosphogluconolactonase [Colletotrichum fructicola]KAF4891240.1 putative 6-phosphogluconolactonase [Colletotrichum fructicola]